MDSKKTSLHLKQQLFIFLLVACAACSPKTYHSGYLGGPPRASTKGQDVPPPPVGKPGECYAISTMPRTYESTNQYYHEFTGSTMPDIGVVETTVEVKPGVESWVKKQATKNCLSADPEDCLVWCLVKEDAVTETFYEVRDTATIKDFKEKVITINYLLSDPYKDWTRVLCQNEITESLVTRTQEALIAKAYLIPVGCSKSMKCLMPALKKFQADNNLPTGQLSYTTFEALGLMP